MKEVLLIKSNLSEKYFWGTFMCLIIYHHDNDNIQFEYCFVIGIQSFNITQWTGKVCFEEDLF